MNIDKLALGTWLMCGTKERDPNNDDAKDIAAIRLAADQGITLIDTAQNYAAGRCEELIGEALHGLPRESYQILTKQSRLRLGYQQVLDDCDASMRRLGVDYLDYFLCHAPNSDFDMHDFFRATNELYEQGKIRNVGVSNFGPKMLQLAVESSDIPIRVNQVHVSLDDDDVFTSGTYDFCIKHGIAVQAYRALVDLGKNPEAVAALNQIAGARSMTTQQIAISYLNSYEGIVFTLRASSKEHWDQIKAALDTQLSANEIETLRATHQNMQGGFGHFLGM